MAIIAEPPEDAALPRSRAPSPNGHAAAVIRRDSSLPDSLYLQYLPAIYRDDPFLRRFLLIFESILAPLEQVVHALPFYTEPEMTPAEFLPWLAHWVALTLDARWPVERQRALIASAIEIYRWRGTRRGLALHIKAYTGVEPLIQEFHDGFALGPNSTLGGNTQLMPAGAPYAPLFVVTVTVPDPATIDQDILREIVEEDKPAHTTYRLRVVHRTETETDGRSRDAAWRNGQQDEGESGP